MKIFFLVFAILLGIVACNKPDAADNAAVAISDSAASEISTLNLRATSEWTNENKRAIHSSFAPCMGLYTGLYPCNRGLQAQSWDNVGNEEKMLANGYELLDENGESFDPKMVIHPLEIVGNLLTYFYSTYNREPESTQELLSWYINKIRNPEEKFKSYDPVEFETQFMESLVSPVTGELIEWNHQDFSEGNAFVKVMNATPESLEFAKSQYIKSWESHPEREQRTDASRLENAVFLLYRAYGRTGVLSEWTSTTFLNPDGGSFTE